MAKTGMKLILPAALGSYAYLHDPRPPPEGQAGEPKYSVSLLFPKGKPIICIDSETKQKIEFSEAVTRVAREGDTEKPEEEFYEGMVFVGASTVRAPGIVDSKAVAFGKLAEQAALEGVEFDPREEAYSGCTFRASVSLYPFDKAGNKGVGVGLNNIMVVAKGPRIDGRKSAEAEFGDLVDSGEGAEDLV
jgi:hypothetical protein